MARSGSLDEVRIVMGNSSYDMDSCVGSLVLAYFYTVKMGKLFLPVLNCSKADFHNKIHIAMHLLEDCKLPEDHLFFMDEFRSMGLEKNLKEVVLFDHNILDPSQTSLSQKVTRIVDHHKEENLYGDTVSERTNRLVGSASTLVVLKVVEERGWFEEEMAGDGEFVGLAYLLAAPITLDTSYFNESLKNTRWTSEDTTAHQFLTKYASVQKPFFDRLIDAMTDQKRTLALGLHPILSMDHKVW